MAAHFEHDVRMRVSTAPAWVAPGTPGIVPAGDDRSRPATEPTPRQSRYATGAAEGAMAEEHTDPGLVPHVDGPVAIDETDRLIASDKVEGTEVFARDGRRLGTLYNFMVDKVTGRVAYAVMTFGGFLGLGERLLPLPWAALSYDPVRGGYVVDVDPDRLAGAPTFAAGEEPWSDPEHRRNVFGFFGFNYGL